MFHFPNDSGNYPSDSSMHKHMDMCTLNLHKSNPDDDLCPLFTSYSVHRDDDKAFHPFQQSFAPMEVISRSSSHHNDLDTRSCIMKPSCLDVSRQRLKTALNSATMSYHQRKMSRPTMTSDGDFSNVSCKSTRQNKMRCDIVSELPLF